jgi:tetratricopeptide (TPR) repeat protein
MTGANEESVFAEALEIEDLQARAAFLDRACAGNPALRKSVQSLLSAYGAGQFLELPAPVPNATTDEPISERPGTVIGPYKLMEQIGEGGMGLVFVAEQQQPVRRKVALKVIKPGMDTRQVVARFEAERQALALMDHTNIAKVLDGGETTSGRPYFVMELVKGVPITEYCDQNRVPVRERLELFSHVCQAIQHAHQKGIIHRDIKPSNVLVISHDGTPLVKVIDFGVAKAIGQQLTDKTIYTQFTQLVGTPLYMSPEQAGQSGLDVDTRSDIYSLGVLLYELLTGTTPFDKERLKEAGYDEIRRIIREEEPARPSTRISTLGKAAATVSTNRKSEPRQLSRLFRGELDWVVMKALEKDRNRRYETANGFAMDVQRYLADEPVLACPPSAWYRFGKFARRNRSVLAIGSVIVTASLLVLAVLAGSVGWVARDKAARQMVTKERVTMALEEARARHKEGKWPEALAAAKRAEALLASGGGDEEIHREVREVLADMQMLANLERARTRHTELSSLGWDHVVEDKDFAQAFRDYGIDIDALDHETAVERIRARFICVDIAVMLDQWSMVRRSLSSRGMVHTGKDWKELLAIARAVDPDPWRDQFRTAVAKQDRQALLALVDSAPIASLPGPTVNRFGSALLGARAYKEGAAFLRKGQDLHPDDFWTTTDLGICLLSCNPPQIDAAIRYYTVAVALRPRAAGARFNLGVALKAKNQLDDAVAEYRKAIELDPKYTAAHHALAGVLVTKNQLDDAIAAYRKAIELEPKLAGTHVDLGNALKHQGKIADAIVEYHKAIKIDSKNAVAHSNLGVALREQGKLDEAVAAFRKAIELEPKTARTHCHLGVALRQQGKPDEAVAAFRTAFDLDPNLALDYKDRAAALLRQGKLNEAIAEFRTAIDLDPKLADAHCGLGVALRQQGKPDEAVAEFRRASDLDPNLVLAYLNRGVALWHQRKLDEAIAEYRIGIDLDPKLAAAHCNLGVALNAKGRLDEAVAAYRKAIDLDPNFAVAHSNLGSALRDLKKLDEAVAECLKAIELEPRFALAHSNLGSAFLDQNKLDEAIAGFRKAIELEPRDAKPHCGLGQALFLQGKLDEAAAECRKAIELNPKDTSAHNSLGLTHRRQGKLDEAVAEFRKAIDLDPKNYQAHMNLGDTLRLQGKLDEAVAEYRETLRLQKDLAPAHENLGAVLFMQGRWDDAVAEFKEAIRLDPDSMPAHRNCAEVLATATDPRLRDGAQAVKLARRAVELAPTYSGAWQALGWALCSTGACKESIEAFRKSMELQQAPKGGDSGQWFGLAVAHWKLGQQEEARTWYDKAVQWMQKNAPQNTLMRHYRAEAEQVLGVKVKQ